MPVSLWAGKAEMERINVTPVEPEEPNPEPGTDPWPEYSFTMAEATTSAQSIVSSYAPSSTWGTAASPKTVVLPAGIHREYVQVPACQYINFVSHPNGTQILASDLWASSNFTQQGSGTHIGKWMSSNTVANVLASDGATGLYWDDRWQYEEIMRITVLPQAGDTVLTVSNNAGLTLRDPIAIGFGYDSCNPYYEHTQIKSFPASNKVEIDDPIVAKYPANYENAAVRGTNPFSIDNAKGQCVPYINDGDARHPEAVWIDGVRQIRKWTGTPAAGQWMLTAGRNVVLGTDPTGKRVEVRRRNHCWRQHEACVHVSQKNMVFFHAGNDGVKLENTSNPFTENCNIGFAHTKGLVQGKSVKPRVWSSRIHDCGQLGLTSTGTDVDIRHNEVDNNAFSSFRSGWEAGGIKFAVCPRVYSYNNHVHHNQGNGMWTDIFAADKNAQRVLLEEDHYHHNAKKGLRGEATMYLTARRCRIHHNGFGTNLNQRADVNVANAGGSYYVLENCIIAFGGNGNVSTGTQARAGRVVLEGCRIENCLMVNESAGGENIIWADPAGGTSSAVGRTHSPYEASANNTGAYNRYATVLSTGAIQNEVGTTGNRYKWSSSWHLIADWRANGNEPRAGQAGTAVLLTDAAAVAAELTENGINPNPRYGLNL